MWCIVDYVLVQEEPFTVIWLASVEGRLQWSDLTRWKARPPSREGLEIHFSPRTAYCLHCTPSFLRLCQILSGYVPLPCLRNTKRSSRACTIHFVLSLSKTYSLSPSWMWGTVHKLLAIKNNHLMRWQSSPWKFTGLTVFLLVFNFNKTVHDDLFFFSLFFFQSPELAVPHRCVG